MNKKFALTALTFVSTAVLAACGAAPTSSSSTAANTIGDTIKIGYNLELSGAVAAYGLAEKNGADLAIEEINAAGGVDGKKLEAVSKDNKSDNTEAATVATNLATQEGVVAIVGPATSGAVAAATPSVTKAGVPLLTPSGTQDSLTIASDGSTNEFIFRTTFQDSFQGQIIAQYASGTLNSKKAFVYYDSSSDYAEGLYKAFKEKYTGEIVESTFQANDKDFQAALTSVKDKGFDTIVILGYYTEAGLITKQAREMGMEQPILGPDGFSDVKFVEGAGAANATNVFYVSGYSTKVSLSDKADSFVAAYKAKYGEEPNMFAALAYDSVYMLAEAAKGATTSKELAANLASLKDFSGVTGSMTIDAQHNPVKSAIMVGLKDGKEDTAVAVE